MLQQCGCEFLSRLVDGAFHSATLPALCDSISPLGVEKATKRHDYTGVVLGVSATGDQKLGLRCDSLVERSLAMELMQLERRDSDGCSLPLEKEVGRIRSIAGNGQERTAGNLAVRIR